MWKVLTPAMEDYVRRINMDGYQREWPPLPAQSQPSHRGVINEAAFLAFSNVAALSREEAGGKLREAVEAGFVDAQRYIYGDLVEELGFKPTKSELREGLALSIRLLNFFESRHGNKKIVISPQFQGSGIISSCRGDIYVEGAGILYEIKGGDRSFRSVDVRQLSVYAALNFGANGPVIKKLGLLNPRRGTFVVSDVDDFAMEISGQSASSLFQIMIECFSGSFVSD